MNFIVWLRVLILVIMFMMNVKALVMVIVLILILIQVLVLAQGLARTMALKKINAMIRSIRIRTKLKKNPF